MQLIVQFFLKLGAVITKWGVVGVLWLASIFFVTSSALLLDAFSDGLSRLTGVVSPYTQQKQKIAQADKRLKAKDVAHKKQIKQQKAAHTKKLNAQKTMVKSHTTKVRGFSKKMVVRNTADATTSMIPIAGGLASVTFAVLDVHAACELITMQKQLESSLGIDDQDSSWEAFCAKSIQTISTMGETAKKGVTQMAEYMPDMPDTSDLPDLPDLPDMPDIPDVAELPDILGDAMCRLTGNCS